MLLLRNVIQPYEWGPINGLAALVDSEPTGDHEAELWVGTHGRGPSTVVGGDHDGRTLADIIAEDPRSTLGIDLADGGAEALPFLLKVLAIGGPLSLQAHPTAEQAEAGFDREDAAGIGLGAADRTYRDRNPKPEALVALVETWLLCGFREPVGAAQLIADLGVGAIDELVGILRGGGAVALHDAMAWMLQLQGPEREQVASQVAVAAAEALGCTEDRSDPRWWVARLAATYPGDPTCLAPLVMEVLKLAPGEAVHLPAGNLHAYLQGAGVEIMQASDNVLRGGLTPKHVDVEELLGVLRFEPGTPPRPSTIEVSEGLTVYDADEETFALARVDPCHGPVTIDPRSPSLLLATGGDVDVAHLAGSTTVGRGDGVFVAPGEGPLIVSGDGLLWWATTGDVAPR